MLGFSAIADTPIAADNREDQYLVLASQSLTLTLSSAAISAGVTQTLASQSLITTLNSPTVQAAANYALQSQNLTLTENSVSVTADKSAVVNVTGESLNLALAPSVAADDCAIASTTICDTPHVNPVLSGVFVHASAAFTATQYFLNATYNQPIFSQSSSISVESQTVLSTLNSLLPSQTVVVGSLNLTATTSGVSVFNGHTIQLASQTLYTTLNGFRIWKIVPTTQLTSCNGYTPGTWKNVVVTNLLGGSNAAIDDQPIATIPENAVPVDIPYQTWTSVDTATTTTWKKTIT